MNGSPSTIPTESTRTMADAREHVRPLWHLALEVTSRCQLACTMCATDSSPRGTDGSMTVGDWRAVIAQAHELGVRGVQIIGGEPMLYPGLAELIDLALGQEMTVEVYSNLVHIPDWSILSRPGVSLATSYFSDQAEQHGAITGSPRHHTRTRANLIAALDRGIPVRVGVIDLGGGQRARQARAELVNLGVPRVGYDQVRLLGRAARGASTPADQLCGACGDGTATIGTDGQIRPCLFARDTVVGDVRDSGLAVVAERMAAARNELIAQGMPLSTGGPCNPEVTGENCYPHNCHPR